MGKTETPPPVSNVQGTPGAKEAFAAIDVADRLIQSAYGDEVPDEWNKAFRSVVKGRAKAPPPQTREGGPVDLTAEDMESLRQEKINERRINVRNGYED